MWKPSRKTVREEEPTPWVQEAPVCLHPSLSERDLMDSKRETDMAAGEKVPVVFLPRFTTLAGANTFITTPMDFLGFEKAELTFWRGDYVPGDTVPPAPITADFESSADLETWATAETVPVPGTAGLATQVTVVPTQRYLRLSVIQTAKQSTTVWCSGYAERTTS